MTSTTGGNNTPGTAVITGAAAGIGAGYADRLAARGYDLILVDMHAERLQRAAELLRDRYGRGVRAVVADLSTSEGLQGIEQILKSDASVNMLINNAGIARLHPLADMTREEIDATIALNVTAVSRLTHAILPAFVAKNSGTIVNVASVLAFHFFTVSAAYSGSKAFVMNYTRALQQELEGTGVRVHLLMPASIQTELWKKTDFDTATLPKNSLMTVDNLVDAALAGLDSGEAVTLPSVEDMRLWESFKTSALALFDATQVSAPASRYKPRNQDRATANT